MTLLVDDVVPRIQYTAGGGQTGFPYPFVLLAEGDVAVEIDGVLKALSVDYTVSGVGVAGGGDITLTSGATAGQVVTIYRNMALERLTDYPPSGDFKSDVLDNDFIRLLLMIQQLARDADRAVRLQVDDGYSDIELPLEADRASKFLAFDANGNVIASTGTGADAGLRGDLSNTTVGNGSDLVARVSRVRTPADHDAVGDGVADDTTALQAMFTAGGDIEIPSNTYKVTAPLTIGSAVKTIRWYGKLTTAYQGVQDSALHPILYFSGFTGVISGRIEIENTSPGSGNACDGIQLENCSGWRCEQMDVTGVRFGLALTVCTDWSIESIKADTMRGWQSGADNGGSILTATGSERGYIGTITGTNVYKAGVYFSVDGVSGDNQDITVDKIDVELANSAVGNTCAIRSGNNISIGSITSTGGASATGGISGLFISREESTYTVDNIHIERLYCVDNTVASSNSNGLYVHSFSSSFPVGQVEIGEVYCEDSQDNSLFVDHCVKLKIGTFRSRAPLGRAILAAGTMNNFEIDYLDLGGAVAAGEILINTGSAIKTLKLGTVVIQDRGASATAPIIITQATVTEWSIDRIEDKTAAPAYTNLCSFGSTLPNTHFFRMGFASTLATNVISVRGDTIVKVFDWKLYNSAKPTGANWPVGTIIYKQTPAGLAQYGWVQTSAGWWPTGWLEAVSADKGDAAATLTVTTSESTNIWNTALTAARAVTLSTTGATEGDKFRVVRTANATGAFNLNVGTGPLKALTAAGQWCDVQYDGAAWILTAAGSL